MSWNKNTGYGLLQAINAYSSSANAGKVIVVCPSTNSNWDRLTQIFSLDNDGTDRVFQTVQAAVNESVLHQPTSSVNTIVVVPDTYNESVTIPHGAGPITIVGYGPNGSASIAPSTVGAHALTVHADDITLINMDLAGEATSTYGTWVTGSRFRCGSYPRPRRRITDV